jgi:MFS transporter, DHA1 family, tetracycline resistance protein
MAFSLFQSIFTLYALERFQIDAQHTGYILAYVGVLSVFTQGFLVGRLTKRYSDPQLIFVASVIAAVGLLGWALSPNIPVLLIMMAPTSMASGVLNTVINSAISKSVPPVEIGGMLGIAASLEASTRVISPSLGGLLLDQVSQQFGIFIGTASPGILATMVMAWLVSYIWRNVIHLKLNEAGGAPQIQSAD